MKPLLAVAALALGTALSTGAAHACPYMDALIEEQKTTKTAAAAQADSES